MQFIKFLISLTVFTIFFLVLNNFVFIKQKQEAPTDTFFQVSTIDALLAGAYDGFINFAELKRHGDFGHGTFDALDGELIALDGKFYKANYDGIVTEVEDTETSPYANIVKFVADTHYERSKLKDFAKLQSYLDRKLKKKNYFYAIKVHGNFRKLKLRSVPKQSKPYKALSEVISKQSIFNLQKNMPGTLVGFYSPKFTSGINVPGYHFHFISDNKKVAGHVLDFELLRDADIDIDLINYFKLKLPLSMAYADANLNLDRSKDLNKVEKNQEENYGKTK